MHLLTQRINCYLNRRRYYPFYTKTKAVSNCIKLGRTDNLSWRKIIHLALRCVSSPGIWSHLRFLMALSLPEISSSSLAISLFCLRICSALEFSPNFASRAIRFISEYSFSFSLKEKRTSFEHWNEQTNEVIDKAR